MLSTSISELLVLEQELWHRNAAFCPFEILPSEHNIS
jgi:hypothetical protein